MPNGSCNGAQTWAILTSRLPAWMFPLPLVWPPINEFRQPALEITMEQVRRVSGLQSFVPSLSHVNVFVFNNVKTYVTYVTKLEFSRIGHCVTPTTHINKTNDRFFTNLNLGFSVIGHCVHPSSHINHINIPMTDCFTHWRGGAHHD